MWKWLRRRAVPRYAFIVIWALFMGQLLYSLRGRPKDIAIGFVLAAVVFVAILTWWLILKHIHPEAAQQIIAASASERGWPKGEAAGLIIGTVLAVGSIIWVLVWK
jgi:tetrahydromethanopterin S-methyltransferase subunit F